MFDVKWLEDALDRLADIWVTAPASLRPRIQSATEITNNTLREDPFRIGESRGKSRARIGFVDLLIIHYTVNSTTLQVQVFYVRLNKGRI